MKTKSITLLILSILSFQFIIAQEKAKLKFKKIEIAYYEPNQSNPTKINLIDYAQINEAGIVKVHLNGNRGLKFYNYQLSDKLIREINSLINDKNALKKALVKTELKPRSHYAGSYNFISFDNQSLCFISPYMSKEFNSIFNEIENIILEQSEKSETVNPKFNINEIEKRILAEHKKSTYLPKIEQSPSGK
jgi:hypothetical protein